MRKIQIALSEELKGPFLWHGALYALESWGPEQPSLPWGWGGGSRCELLLHVALNVSISTACKGSSHTLSVPLGVTVIARSLGDKHAPTTLASSVRPSLFHGVRGSAGSPANSSSLSKAHHIGFSLCSLFFKHTGSSLPQKMIPSIWFSALLTDSLSSLNSRLKCHFLKNSFPEFPEVCTSPCYFDLHPFLFLHWQGWRPQLSSSVLERPSKAPRRKRCPRGKGTVAVLGKERAWL